MKKFFAVVASLSLCAMLSVTAFAAGSLNTFETAILDALKASVTVNGTTVSVPSAQLNDVEKYFMSEGVDVTDAQSQIVLAQIQKGKDYVIANGITDLTRVNVTQGKALVAIAQPAADALNVRIVADYVNGTVTVYDASGNVISYMESPIKNTGLGFETTAMIGAMLLGVMGVATVLAKKKGYFVR
ncbi:MAG: hypothetical protein ACRDBX_04170 [Erysipelotrichaceae bacterium]